MQAHHRRLLLNGRDHLCMRDGFGFPGTIDSMEAGMCGCVAAGSTRLGVALCGFPAAGCPAAGAMSTSPDPGVNATDFASTSPWGRREAISTAWHSSLALSSKVQREPSYELKRVFLVSDLGIIQEVIDRRYRKGQLLVDGQPYASWCRRRRRRSRCSRRCRPELFHRTGACPTSACTPRSVSIRSGGASSASTLTLGSELLTFVVQIGCDIKLRSFFLNRVAPIPAPYFCWSTRPWE